MITTNDNYMPPEEDFYLICMNTGKFIKNETRFCPLFLLKTDWIRSFSNCDRYVTFAKHFKCWQMGWKGFFWKTIEKVWTFKAFSDYIPYHGFCFTDEHYKLILLSKLFFILGRTVYLAPIIFRVYKNFLITLWSGWATTQKFSKAR